MSSGLIPCNAPAEAVAVASKATSEKLDRTMATRPCWIGPATIAAGLARARPRSPVWPTTRAHECWHAPTSAFRPLPRTRACRASRHQACRLRNALRPEVVPLCLSVLGDVRPYPRAARRDVVPQRMPIRIVAAILRAECDGILFEKTFHTVVPRFLGGRDVLT